jgi:hypothetical protein
MGDIAIVAQKAEQLCQLARGIVVEAASGLSAAAAERASGSSIDEMKLRIERAIKQLQGKRSLLSIAEEMIDSYRFEGDRLSFVVPAGQVNADVEALRALNKWSWQRYNHEAILTGDLWQFEDFSSKYPEICPKRDPGVSRMVTLQYDRLALERGEQEAGLRSIGCQFADIRDIALACALHRLAYSGACLLSWDKPARSEIPDVVLCLRSNKELMLGAESGSTRCCGFFVERGVSEGRDEAVREAQLS